MKTKTFALALTALTALSIASSNAIQVRNDRVAASRSDLELILNEDELKSLSLKASSGMAAGGGGGTGKASFSDLSIMKVMDKSSPMLAKAMATGKHFPKATLSVRKAGGRDRQDYLKIVMEDVVISGYQTSPSSGGDRPMESVSFNYAKIEFEYKPQKER